MQARLWGQGRPERGGRFRNLLGTFVGWGGGTIQRKKGGRGGLPRCLGGSEKGFGRAFNLVITEKGKKDERDAGKSFRLERKKEESGLAEGAFLRPWK